MARHDRGRGLSECAGLHVMGEVGDHRPVHPQVDLDRRSAQLGVSGGTCVGVGEPAQAWNIPGQLDDAIVVNVIQHRMEFPSVRAWRPDVMVLYMEASGRNTVRRYPQASGGTASAPSAGDTPVLLTGRTE